MTNEEFHELHRRWIWANIIKKQFEGVIPSSVKGGAVVDPHRLFVDHYGCFMSIWYGMLFVVLEGLRDLGIAIQPVQVHIDEQYESLRLFRNATFHPQRKYWSPKIFKIMEDPDSARKTWMIHSGLGKFFLEEGRKRRKDK